MSWQADYNVGDVVKSWDFPDSMDDPSRPPCYVVGKVMAIAWYNGCDRYAIDVYRDVWQGKDVPYGERGSRVGTRVFPPLNKVTGSPGGVRVLIPADLGVYK